MLRGFASDNNAGIHPDILKAIADANIGHCVAYGNDPFTLSALRLFRERFGAETETFFLFGGTAANVLGLAAITKSHHAVICAASAHINVDECGAPEKFTGCKLLPIPTKDGKITVPDVEQCMRGIGDEHHVQPRVISITQATEYGTVYSVKEVLELSCFAHTRGLLLHMDGARIANAAAHLQEDLVTITRHAGVDVLSVGGTKNGMLFGEAVIFFAPSFARDFRFIRKQGMQLPSKMRFIGAQFKALLSNDLWLRNATHANRMARKLAHLLIEIPGITITQKVESNAVFATIPKDRILRIQEKYFFYVWNEEKGEVRWMTSFDTTEEDVERFVKYVAGIIS